METPVRIIITFALALIFAAGAFILTILIKPSLSQAEPVASIDTYALTINSKLERGEDYDCN